MFSLSGFKALPAVMLVSIVNTQLRDHFASLEELALYHDISAAELTESLASEHFFYDISQNQFKQR